MEPIEKGSVHKEIVITPTESGIHLGIVDEIGSYQALLYENGVNGRSTLYIEGDENFDGLTLLRNGRNDYVLAFRQADGSPSFINLDLRGRNGTSIDSYYSGNRTDFALDKVVRLLSFISESGNEEVLAYLRSYGFTDKELEKILALINDSWRPEEE